MPKYALPPPPCRRRNVAPDDEGPGQSACPVGGARAFAMSQGGEENEQGEVGSEGSGDITESSEDIHDVTIHGVEAEAHPPRQQEQSPVPQQSPNSPCLCP